MPEKGEKEARICPDCGSTNLKWLLAGQTGDQYKCTECAYQGPALQAGPKFIKKMKEKDKDA